MLKARVISEGVRATNPGVAVGVYTVEEVQDFSAAEKDVTPSAPITPTTGALDAITAKRQEIVMATAAEIKKKFSEDKPMDALGLWVNSRFTLDEQKATWSLLPSDIRSALKRLDAAETAAADGTISEPQKKRLEALVKEYGLDREKVKDFCKKAYNKDHFSELTPAEYTDLAATLKALKEDQDADL